MANAFILANFIEDMKLVFNVPFLLFYKKFVERVKSIGQFLIVFKGKAGFLVYKQIFFVLKLAILFFDTQYAFILSGWRNWSVIFQLLEPRVLSLSLPRFRASHTKHFGSLVHL